MEQEMHCLKIEKQEGGGGGGGWKDSERQLRGLKQAKVHNF